MSSEDAKLIQITANGATCQVRRGKPLLAGLLQARVRQLHLCGGRGLCSTCRVVVEDGAEHLSPLERKELVSLRVHGSFSAQVRLACQARVFGPVQVRSVFPTWGTLPRQEELEELDARGIPWAAKERPPGESS